MKEILKRVLPRNFVIFLKTTRQLLMAPFILLVNRKSSDKSGQVILTRLDGAGDFAIWLDSAKEFRRLYPDSKITVLCKPSPAALAKHLDYFDDVVPIDMDKLYKFDLASIISTHKKLASLHCNVLIQCVYSRTLAMDYITACIPAAEKISIDSDASQTGPVTPYTKRFTDRIYSRLVLTPHAIMHELLRNSKFMNGLGSDMQPHLSVISTIRIDNSIIPESKYFVVFPGSAEYIKSWDIEKFAETAMNIYTKTHFACCVCGSETEKKLADDIKKLCGDKIKIIDMTGKTDLAELTETIRHAEFLVGCDTSAIHIAATVETRSVCIHGLSTMTRYLPYPDGIKSKYLPLVCSCEMPCMGCNNIYTKECYGCIAEFGKRLCIHNVSVEDVIKKIDLVIFQNKNNTTSC